MNFYWIKTNSLIKWLFPKFIWSIPNHDNSIYLTFDDGPTPEVTPWVLNVLKEHNIKATFFCIGDNVRKHPEIFKQLIADGHAVGNHTLNHLKGWETSLDIYMENIEKCDVEMKKNGIETQLFRPPYGKITRSQTQKVLALGKKIMMWDILTVDYDTTVSKEKCLQHATQKAASGSIIIFHDSVKAFPNLEFALPRAIKILKEKGLNFEILA